MLYLEQMHETAQNRTNEREQARHTDRPKATAKKSVKNCEKVVDNGGGMVYIIITAGNR